MKPLSSRGPRLSTCCSGLLQPILLHLDAFLVTLSNVRYVTSAFTLYIFKKCSWVGTYCYVQPICLANLTANKHHVFLFLTSQVLSQQSYHVVGGSKPDVARGEGSPLLPTKRIFCWYVFPYETVHHHE